MNDQKKSKAQLIEELTALRRRVAELEQAEAERKQAEEALRESEELYRQTISSISDAVFLTDDHHNFIFVCPNIDLTFGWSEDEVMAIGNLRVLIGNDPLIPNEVDGEVRNIEWDIVDKSGRSHTLLVNIKRVSINKATRLYACRDITERKQVTEMLRASERLLADIAANYPNSYLSIIEKDFTIGFTGGQEFKKQNLDPQGFVGLSLEQVFGEHTPTVREYYLKTFQGEETSFELCINNQHQLYKVVPLYDQQGQITRILAVVENITERKRAEEKLQQSNDLLRAIIEAAPTAIIGLDLDGNVQMVWNPAAEKMLGWSAQEAMGHPLPSVPVEGQEEFRGFRERIRSGLTLDGVEVRRQRRDGSPIDYSIYASPLHNAEGQISGNVAVLVDIAERKRAEESLRQEKERAQMYLDITPAIILALDTNGCVSLINEQGCRILECDRDEIIGKNWFDTFLPERVRTQVKGIFNQILTGDVKPVEYIENVILTGKGNERIVQWHNTVLKDETGRVIGTLAAAEDITERKQAEEQIKASLREKEVMLQEIHHRVKNNLQVISSLLDMQADTIDDPRLLQAFQDSQQRVRSMALVHEKLYQSTDLAHIDFAGYVQEMVDYLFMLYSHQAGPIIPRLEVEEVFLGVDQAIPCGLIINELVSNALKHAFPPPLTSPPLGGIEGGQSPLGGTGGKQSFPTPEIRVAFAAQDGECVLVVGDNGVGLPPELDIETSSSLGLQLVNILVRQLQGSLEIGRHKGATFKLTFPENQPRRRAITPQP